jgi:pimeloyl-ACP methyl ester carboxylesterase
MPQIPRTAICGLVVCLLSGCLGTTPHAQLRTVAVPDPFVKNSLGSFTDTTNLTDKALAQKVGERIVERYNEFDLGIVEFDDQGKLWNKDQLDALDNLANDPDAIRNGAMILVFVHGWQENADVANPTVDRFRHMLYRWNLDEGPDGRRIIGVYVGWRGQSQRLPFLKYLTFWTRKKAAHKIGRGDMDELLVHLDELKHRLTNDKTTAKPNGTRLVVIGHSFGGAIVFSALDNILKKSTMASVLPFERNETNTVGVITAGNIDLVVLLNPAFETLLYSGLAEATMNCTNFNPSQTTVLMTIGAENDQATGTSFPMGQFFPTLLQNFNPKTDERVMNRTALGHYTRYFDYELSSNTATNSDDATASDTKHQKMPITRRTKADFQAAARSSTNGIASSLSTLAGSHWKLMPYLGKPEPPLHTPFLVISATPDIVNNHTGIWKPALIEFLRDFIGVHDASKSDIEKTQPAPKP